MRANELKGLVHSLYKNGRAGEARDRVSVEYFLADARDAIKAAGKNNVANQIQQVIDEIEMIPTEDLIAEGLFKRR